LDTVNNSIWNNSVYGRTKKKTMKKSQLVQVIKEELAKKQDIDSIITRYIDTDDATELKAYLKSIPDRARTKIAKLLKIDLNEDGYERKDGKLVPHSDKFNSTKLSSILTRIAKERPEEEEYQGDPNTPLHEENKLEKYVVFFYTNDDDHDWDVMATSEEDAIQKVKSGEAKGPYGQSLPRLARKFSAKKLG
jgi:hypothetical protein